MKDEWILTIMIFRDTNGTSQNHMHEVVSCIHGWIKLTQIPVENLLLIINE